MEDLKQKLQRLLQSSDWSAEDRAWLLEYLEKNDTAALQQIMQQQFTEQVKEGEEVKEDWAKELLEHIHQKLRPVAKPAKIIRLAIWKRVAAAAIIIAIGLGAYILMTNKGEKEIAKTENKDQYQNDVAPGGNRATLQLADGSTIILDSVQNGTLTQQGNTKVLKLDNGQLAYAALNEKPTEVLYNTVSTPRGGQYQLTLSDGSKIWLNAASSIRFPAAFVGNERKVEITGEAYFEVAKDAVKKFVVSSNGVQTQVLGTHFNVNAYADESSIKVTLLEGLVRITKENTTSLLSPGQQADIANSIQIIKGINTDEVISWKDGFFHFESADLKTILRQFARWYDIEVVYKGTVSSEKYFSIMNRNSSLSNVLKSLQANGIKFKIDNKKLYIE